VILRTRILLLLTLVVVGFVVGDAVVQGMLVTKRFEGLERGLAEVQLREIQEDLLSRRGRLAAVGRRTGIRLRDPEVGLEIEPRIRADGVDLFFLLEPDGSVLASATLTPETHQPLRLRDFPEEAFSTRHPLLDPSVRGGLLETEHGLLQVGIADLEPAYRGGQTLRAITGEFLTDRVLAQLGDGRGTSVSLSTLSGDGLSSMHLDDVLSNAPVFEQLDDDRLIVEDVLLDVRGLPAALLTVQMPRELNQIARRSASDSMLSGASAAILLLLTLVFILQRSVIEPLRKLTDHAVLIGETNDTTQRLESDRTDELGTLAREFDRMVSELERSRTQMAEMARLAGASEIATGVLHNVGNVLNSVNVSAKLSARTLHKLPIEDLRTVAQELETHRDTLDEYVREDPRGRHVIPFLAQLESSMSNAQDDVRRELDELLQGLDHMMSLVQSQIGYANRTSAATWVRIENVVEQAITFATQARPASLGMRIDREFEETASLSLERHKLLEILVNLLVNAFDSLELAEREDPHIVLRILQQEDTIAIEVEDCGVGIEPENLEQVFVSGYTTKPNGQGIGLHTCSLSSNDLGGVLVAESPGPGRGATFRLTLPARRVGEAA